MRGSIRPRSAGGEISKPVATSGTPAFQRTPRRRWLIALLMGAGVLVNYTDRVSLSVSQDSLHAAFGISTVTFGWLLGAYSWTYGLMQLPVGVLLDRFGVRKVGAIGSFLWSVASFGSAITPTLDGLYAARFLLGIGEAPIFPGNAKAIGYWFPDRERSLATAIFDASAKLAPALGVPVVGILLLHFGWRWSFAATGFFSLIYFGFFTAIYRNPSEDPKLSAAEHRMILEGGAQPERKKESERGASLFYLLRQPKVWGVSIGFAAYNYTFYLLLNWLPSYLSSALHVDLLHSALYTSVPWMIAAVTDLAVGGWLVDTLIEHGWPAGRVRQIVLVAGTALGIGIVGAGRAHTAQEALFWISVSIGGLAAAAPVAWSVPTIIAPRETVGRLGGVMNFFSQISAVSAPIVTGMVVGKTHSYQGAFLIAGVFLAIGIVSYVLLLGPMEPIAEPATNASP